MTTRELTVLKELTGDVEAIVSKYPNKRSATLPLLFLAQSVEGYVTEEGMRDVAQVLELTPAEVLAVASFYTMLKKTPTGDYLISVCRNISCTHMGGRKVLKAFESELGITAGQTTDDGRFSLEAAECLATCDGAPSIQINYEDLYKVTPEEATELVGKLRAGNEVRSVAGEAVKTHTEISREVAITGIVNKTPVADVPGEQMRTIGGESPPADVAPGFRPPLIEEKDED